MKIRAYSEKEGMINIDNLYWFEEEGVMTWDGEGFHDNYKLMRGTGLKDCEGKDIFEGDIVEWYGWEVRSGKQIRPVRRITVGVGLTYPKEVTGDFIYDCYHLSNLISSGSVVKIVGNIHEIMNECKKDLK